MRALRFHKKRIHRQHCSSCCRWILFSRRGLSWHRLCLLYIMVWRERGNRPYRRHFSPRTVPAVPYLKETPPWNTRKTPFALFCSAREKKKARIPSPEHLSSFFEPLPLRSTQRSQFNLLRHFCVIFTQIVPQSQKRNTPHSYFSYALQFFFISLLTHSRIAYQRYHSYCSDSTKRRRKRMTFTGLSSVKYESNLD